MTSQCCHQVVNAFLSASSLHYTPLYRGKSEYTFYFWKWQISIYLRMYMFLICNWFKDFCSHGAYSKVWKMTTNIVEATDLSHSFIQVELLAFHFLCFKIRKIIYKEWNAMMMQPLKSEEMKADFQNCPLTYFKCNDGATYLFFPCLFFSEMNDYDRFFLF
jgi:hypothetical protein